MDLQVMNKNIPNIVDQVQSNTFKTNHDSPITGCLLKVCCLPRVLCELISEYAWEFELVSFVKENLDKVKVDWDLLSGNPNAIHILGKNLDKIDWNCLSENPNAINFIGTAFG